LGGFVISELQRIPRSGDSFEFENKKFTVLKMEGHRVGQVRLDTLPAPISADRAAS
jgi:CBS domain containing-hemolysin-like protein